MAVSVQFPLIGKNKFKSQRLSRDTAGFGIKVLFAHLLSRKVDIAKTIKKGKAAEEENSLNLIRSSGAYGRCFGSDKPLSIMQWQIFEKELAAKIYMQAGKRTGI